MGRVEDFFADIDLQPDDPEKCSESNTTIGSVEKKSFRLNGLKRGTTKQEGETQQQYRARRVFSDMISSGLRWLGADKGDVDELALAILISIDADELNEHMGRSVTAEQTWYECRKSAREALRMWDPATVRRIKATASKAGAVTKWNLEDFLETREMSVTAAMRYLREKKGIKSRTTVYEMRKHYDGLNVETGEVT